MAYVDGFVAAVPEANREAYLAHAGRMAGIIRRLGAERCVETWGDDVPEGEHTSFPMAVRREPGEAVIFSWVWWPDKATRDVAWKAIMTDPEAMAEEMPFDGKRMLLGGFEVIVDA